MDHRRWFDFAKFIVVLVSFILSHAAHSQSSEFSLHGGVIQLRSRELVNENPDFDLKFKFCPSYRFNYQVQTAPDWWVGVSFGHGQIQTNYFLKQEHLPKYHARLGFVAIGGFVDAGAFVFFRRLFNDKWLLQGKIGLGLVSTPKVEHYITVQEGFHSDLKRFGQIKEFPSEDTVRGTIYSYFEIQAGRKFGRHRLALSVAYQRFGFLRAKEPAYFFEKKFEIYTGNSTYYFANLRYLTADACRMELVYSLSF